MNGSLPMQDLTQYLWHSGWLASVQFALFVAIFCGLADRGGRAWGWFGERLDTDDKIASPVLDQVTCACMGMGLLLTFSGLYTYVGGGQQEDRWPLLLALGSSALGYGAWTLFALAGMWDHARAPREARREPTDRATESRPRDGQLWEPRKDGRYESEPVDYSGGGSGHLGGAVPDAIVELAEELGSSRGRGSFAHAAGVVGWDDRAGVGDAAGDGDLAGPPPADDDAGA